MAKYLICHNTAKVLFMHYGELLKSLASEGHEVHCVTPCDVTKNHLREYNVKHHKWEIKQHGTSIWGEVKGVCDLNRITKEINPDIYLGITIKPIVYGKVALIGRGVSSRNYMFSGLGYIFINESLKTRLVRAFFKMFIKFTSNRRDRYIFQNKDDMDLFIRKNIIEGEFARVINGVGVDVRYYSRHIQPMGDSKRIRYIFVGRVLKDKGVFEYIKAAEEIKKENNETEFLVLGPIDDNPSALTHEEMKNWERKGVIKYFGEVDDVRKYLEESDVFVLPSYREGLPRATCEAMAMGLPIITTDAPGCRETVQQKINGYLVPVKDYLALANEMKRFIQCKRLIYEMGLRSREMAEDKFSVEYVVNDVINILREVRN